MNSLIYVFSIKSLSENIWKRPILNNITLNQEVLIGGILVFLSFVFSSLRKMLELEYLSFELVSFAILLAFIQIILIELTKEIYFNLQKNK